jgi:hypothetical protein
MVYYSAESVIAELKANNVLICEGIDDMGCPSPAPSSITHEGRRCKTKKGFPCDDCINQACTQWIIVHSNEYIKLGMLMFLFVFPVDPRGRIPKDDSHLRRFTKHKLINESKLEVC